MVHWIWSLVFSPLDNLSIDDVYFKGLFRCNRMTLSKCDTQGEGTLVLLCLKTGKTMMLWQIFLLAMKVGRWEKYLAGLGNACIMDVDIHMDLTCICVSKWHQKHWSRTNFNWKRQPYFQCNFYWSRLLFYLSSQQDTIQNGFVGWEWVSLNILEACFLEMSCKWAAV